MSPRENPRSWWPLASKPPLSPTNPTSRALPKPASGLKFSLASAIGFKSKKTPSLAVHEPPTPICTFPAIPDRPYYASRAPSQSVSSTRSRADSSEPRTPSDSHRDPLKARHSLLTLSDADPFAGRAIVTPHTPDHNRLSAYSNSSIPDFVSKNGYAPIFNRTSYGSSSSNSNHHTGNLSPSTSAMSPSASLIREGRRVVPKKSAEHLHAVDDSPCDALPVANSLSKASSSTLNDIDRRSQPEPSQPRRPPMRARGMTDGGGTQTSPDIYRNGGSHPILPSARSPRVIVRQASVSRIGQPITAPPSQDLPPPPPIKHVAVEHENEAADGSASSSTLSFASSISSNREIMANQSYIPRQRQKSADNTFFSSNKADKSGGKAPAPKSYQAQVESSRTLKKASSHHSLVNRGHSAHNLSPTPLDRTEEPTPRKQRSFHHPRIPLPAIPMSLRQAGSSSHAPSIDHATTSEQKRGYTSPSTPGRKRLFSGPSHRRPSTSHSSPAEDDARSVFSLPAEHEHSAGSKAFSAHSSLHSSSAWDDPALDHGPISPLTTKYEYTPQQIMSPAEMAKVEASVEASSLYSRRRGMSVVSSSTTISDMDDDHASTGLHSPSSVWATGWQNGFPFRRSSMASRGISSPPLSTRPSTSQSNMTPPHSPYQFSFDQSSFTLTSLPPPPRPRRPPLASDTITHSNPTPLSLPPVYKAVRPKPSVERSLHRKSVMRKPSFLEIDDDTDRDTDVDVEKPLTGSFLNLDRESFDTVRSFDESQDFDARSA